LASHGVLPRLGVFDPLRLREGTQSSEDGVTTKDEPGVVPSITEGVSVRSEESLSSITVAEDEFRREVTSILDARWSILDSQRR
jgi:hypothetical protein